MPASFTPLIIPATGGLGKGGHKGGLGKGGHKGGLGKGGHKHITALLSAKWGHSYSSTVVAWDQLPSFLFLPAFLHHVHQGRPASAMRSTGEGGCGPWPSAHLKLFND